MSASSKSGGELPLTQTVSPADRNPLQQSASPVEEPVGDALAGEADAAAETIGAEKLAAIIESIRRQAGEIGYAYTAAAAKLYPGVRAKPEDFEQLLELVDYAPPGLLSPEIEGLKGDLNNFYYSDEHTPDQSDKHIDDLARLRREALCRSLKPITEGEDDPLRKIGMEVILWDAKKRVRQQRKDDIREAEWKRWRDAGRDNNEIAKLYSGSDNDENFREARKQGNRRRELAKRMRDGEDYFDIMRDFARRDEEE